MNRNSSQTILLIDDDAKNLQVAMNILKDYKVIFAQNGQKALELLDKHDSFDLILLDIVMPIMDGYETCKLIKSNKKYKDIPIIFLTVKDEEQDIVKGFELGAVDYLVKPFYPEVLLKRVELHLNLYEATFNLKELNSSLNKKVFQQIEEIREKDRKIAQQEKNKAMNNVVGIISSRMKKPISSIKLHLQSLEIMFEKEKNQVIAKSFRQVLDEIQSIEEGIGSFSSIFSVDKKNENINLKVLIDNILYKYRSELEVHNIEFNFIGDNLLTINAVKEEIKQIFSKMILISFNSFKQSEKEKKLITLKIEKNKNLLNIFYEDNSAYSKFENLESYFDNDFLIKSDKFDIDLYVLKIYVEKNGGEIILKENETKGVLYVITLPTDVSLPF